MTPSARPYRVCGRCVMDTSDREIRFTADGGCNHCRDFLAARARLPRGADRERALEELVAEIRAAGRGRQHDCVVGVSGGVDSTYVAYLARKLGLRPLAVHVDNGWNSELAVGNIERAMKVLGIDLHTHVLDWEEFRELQVAFLRASVSDAELPTDHAIRAVLLKEARRAGVKYLLNGRNLSTEGILPWSWTYSALDWRYIRGVHRRCGRGRLRRYPHTSLASLLWAAMARRIRNIGILNYADYSKRRAMQILTEELGWRDYGGKHYESIYTRFFQAYILPRKFGIDKRRAHSSVLVMTGEMAREEALRRLEEPPDGEERLTADKVYVCKKLGLSSEEFDAILREPIKTYRDYPNDSRLLVPRRRPALHGLLKAMKRFKLLPQGFADHVAAEEPDVLGLPGEGGAPAEVAAAGRVVVS